MPPWPLRSTTFLEEANRGWEHMRKGALGTLDGMLNSSRNFSRLVTRANVARNYVATVAEFDSGAACVPGTPMPQTAAGFILGWLTTRARSSVSLGIRSADSSWEKP